MLHGRHIQFCLDVLVCCLVAGRRRSSLINMHNALLCISSTAKSSVTKSSIVERSSAERSIAERSLAKRSTADSNNAGSHVADSGIAKCRTTNRTFADSIIADSHSAESSTAGVCFLSHRIADNVAESSTGDSSIVSSITADRGITTVHCWRCKKVLRSISLRLVMFSRQQRPWPMLTQQPQHLLLKVA